MPYWTTKEGVKIPISDMDDKHLNNAIKHLENVFVETGGYIPTCDCFGDVEFFNVDVYISIEDIYPIIVELRKEKEHRGIQ